VRRLDVEKVLEAREGRPHLLFPLFMGLFVYISIPFFVLFIVSLTLILACLLLS
jgi:hypothetical protein